MTPLKIKKIHKHFDQKHTLNDINFTVENNEIFGFIGLNGAGKTTLIKIIIDLLDEDSGDVEIFGLNKILPKSREKICYLPEKFNPPQNLTGQEFIKFVLNFYKKTPNPKEIEQICQKIDLNPKFLPQKIRNYSKGMTQKLGLIATFLSKSPLIILDEPMSGLDPKARIKLKKIMLDFKKNGGTILFSSHILSDIDEICDKIAILNNAQIAFHGTAKKFKDQHGESSLENAFLKEIKEL